MYTSVPFAKLRKRFRNFTTQTEEPMGDPGSGDPLEAPDPKQTRLGGRSGISFYPDDILTPATPGRRDTPLPQAEAPTPPILAEEASSDLDDLSTDGEVVQIRTTSQAPMNAWTWDSYPTQAMIGFVEDFRGDGLRSNPEDSEHGDRSEEEVVEPNPMPPVERRAATLPITPVRRQAAPRRDTMADPTSPITSTPDTTDEGDTPNRTNWLQRFVAVMVATAIVVSILALLGLGAAVLGLTPLELRSPIAWNSGDVVKGTEDSKVPQTSWLNGWWDDDADADEPNKGETPDDAVTETEDPDVQEGTAPDIDGTKTADTGEDVLVVDGPKLVKIEIEVTPEEPSWLLCSSNKAKYPGGMRAYRFKTEHTELEVEEVRVRGLHTRRMCVDPDEANASKFETRPHAEIWRNKCWIDEVAQPDLEILELCADSKGELVSRQEVIAALVPKDEDEQLLATTWTPMEGFETLEAMCCPGSALNTCMLKGKQDDKTLAAVH